MGMLVALCTIKVLYCNAVQIKTAEHANRVWKLVLQVSRPNLQNYIWRALFYLDNSYFYSYF